MEPSSNTFGPSSGGWSSSGPAAIERYWRRRPAESGSTRRDIERLARVEAALFVADRPLTAARLAKAAVLLNAAEARELVASLNVSYDAAGAAFRVDELASGYRLLTRPPLAFFLSQIVPAPPQRRLSPAQLETLTIVAYRQPVTRAEVEAVRGVASLELLKQVRDAGYIRIVGEDDSLGRPFLYGTTPAFLDAFGLSSLDDLPDRDGLAA